MFCDVVGPEGGRLGFLSVEAKQASMYHRQLLY